MRIKRKLDMDRYETMIRDLETMHQKGEVSDQTYEEMKSKYDEKLKEFEEMYFEDEDTFEEIGELGGRIGEKVEEAVERSMEKLHRMLEQIPEIEYEGNREHFTAEEVHEGSFSSDQVEIDFATINGHIDLTKWDKDTYKIVVTKKVRAFSRERAEERLAKIEVPFEHRKNGKDVLRLKVEEDHVIVSIAGYLPTTKGGLLSKNMVYDLDLESVNGHITVTGLNTGKAKVETENGRIGIEDVRSHDLDLETENGRILLENVETERGSASTENGRLELLNVKGKSMAASTENGSVRGKVAFEHAELETENGSIRITPQGKGEYTVKTENGSISIEVDRNVPHEIKAETGMGRVSVAPDLEITSKGKRHALVKSASFTGEGLSIEAESEMGSISIE